MQRAREAGVSGFVCIGSGRSLEEVTNAEKLASTHENMWAAIAIHPHDAAAMSDSDFNAIAELARTSKKIVCIGETGLDYYYDHSPRDMQKTVMTKFVGLARELRLPLSLHIRDAHEDALAILLSENAADVGGVVHCFTGDERDAERYLALGFYISFSGIVTFKSARPIQAAAKLVPANKILIETDCPYLAPVPMRGKRNEPAYLVHTARFVADLRGVPFDEFSRTTRENTQRLFGLGDSLQ